jgi:hypothetical protein
MSATISKLSLAAHNANRAWPSANQSLNTDGSSQERSLLESISQGRYGYGVRKGRLTAAYISKNTEYSII